MLSRPDRILRVSVNCDRVRYNMQFLPENQQLPQDRRAADPNAHIAGVLADRRNP